MTGRADPQCLPAEISAGKAAIVNLAGGLATPVDDRQRPGDLDDLGIGEEPDRFFDGVRFEHIVRIEKEDGLSG